MNTNYHSSYVDYVVKNYPTETIPLEIGAGYHSTQEFSKHFNKMYSVENNADYILNFHDNYIHVLVDPLTGWYEQNKFRESLPLDYNLIILDGPLGGFATDDRLCRMGFVKMSWHDVKKDCHIIVDDVHRDWKEREVVSFLKDQGYKETNHGGFSVLEPGV